ncbi:MAG: hypothetical protein IJY47_02365 [Clostridia bacterium]|nr:hypothetical protein [Clostridia bacterium]
MGTTITCFGHITEEGTSLVEWRLMLPSCELWRGMEEFYRELGDDVITRFCEGVLGERARREYAESGDPLKRFHFPAFRYTLEGKICYETASLISIRLDAALRRKGEHAPRSVGVEAHTWEVESGMLLPPKQVLEAVGEEAMSRKERRMTKSVLLTAEGIFLCDGTKLFPRENKKI